MLVSFEPDIINSADNDGVPPLRLAIRRKDRDLIEFLLKKSADTKGIGAGEWRAAYRKHASDIVKLSEGQEGMVEFMSVFPEGELPDGSTRLSAENGIRRCLLCVISCLLSTKWSLTEFRKPDPK